MDELAALSKEDLEFFLGETVHCHNAMKTV